MFEIGSIDSVNCWDTMLGLPTISVPVDIVLTHNHFFQIMLPEPA